MREYSRQDEWTTTGLTQRSASDVCLDLDRDLGMSSQLQKVQTGWSVQTSVADGCLRVLMTAAAPLLSKVPPNTDRRATASNWRVVRYLTIQNLTRSRTDDVLMQLAM